MKIGQAMYGAQRTPAEASAEAGQPEQKEPAREQAGGEEKTVEGEAEKK